MSPAVKVGLFALLALVIGAALILRIEDFDLFRRSMVEYRVQLRSARGLELKAPVRLSGVKVGSVKEIELENGAVEVTIEVEKGTPVRRGTTAGVESLGLLGEKHMELNPGPADAPLLPEGSILSSRDAADIDDAVRLANEIGQDVRSVTENLRKTLGGEKGEERMEIIVDSLAQLTERLATLVAQNQDSANRTVANFEAFSSSMKVLADRVEKLSARNEDNVDRSLENLDQLTERLRSAADHLNNITRKIDQGQGTLGQLVESRETSDRINETLASVQVGVDALTDVVTQVVDTKIFLGMRGEYLTGIAAGKGYFSLDIVPPDSTRFYRVEALTQPFGLRQLTTTITTTTVDDGPPVVTTEVRERFRDRFAFSAMVAQRLGPLTVRGGVLESTGGGAVDLDLLDERLRLTAEMWDFDRNGPSPHAKVWAAIYPFPYLYLSVGWDDFLNVNRDLDSVFIGGGTRWDADDLKYLLPRVPTP